MKHIRLYEYYSELPTSFSVAEIQNMSETDFLTNLKMLKDKGDEEQAFSLLQIWMNHHKDAANDMDFNAKLGGIFRDVSLESDDSPKSGNFLHDKAVQLNTYLAKNKREGVVKQIEEVKRNIKNYEEMLRVAKDRLDRLEFEMTKTM
jgi:hypothetical protein